MSLRNLTTDVVTQIGAEVTVKGWINARRNMGKIVFLDLRDRAGILQLVGVPSQMDAESVECMKEVRPEWVIEVKGVVQERGVKQKNADMPTGTVELLIKSLTVLNKAETPPFEIDKDTKGINEELRLKYRYLDLRSERMQKNIRLRDKMVSFFRNYLHAADFVEIETPNITKVTVDSGAREFLVPSRVHAGKFYSLPQSPQQFKQLLMVAGFERYFQIARCFRDEDQRGDRQPEFTQLDLEMSFVEREDVLNIIEDMLVKMVAAVTPDKRLQQVPFPRLSYAEAMEKYGTDKPDLREDKNDPNLLAFAWVIDFPFFEKTEDAGWTFTHNPFSRPKPEHMPWLMEKSHIGEILTSQYDIVLNGYEAGGGSIRNHEPAALRSVLEIIGLSEEQIKAQFGHMLEAFTFGAPPHGGIAPGIDRIAMLLAGEPNIREVIAFPKTGDARDLMMDAPSEMPEKSLDEVHIALKNAKKK